MVSAGTIAAANAARRYRFRNGRGAHNLWLDWREVLGLSGRKSAATREGRVERGSLRKRADHYVDAEEGEVPQAAARPAHRKGVARRRAGVWRLRTQGHGAGLDHRPPNRSVARRHHAFYQARRKTLDSHFSGQAVYQETGRNAHG